MLGGDLLEEALAAIPDEWLGSDVSPFADVASHREAYRRFLTRRFEARAGFTDEAVAAQGLLAGTGGGR